MWIRPKRVGTSPLLLGLCALLFCWTLGATATSFTLNLVSGASQFARLVDNQATDSVPPVIPVEVLSYAASHCDPRSRLSAAGYAEATASPVSLDDEDMPSCTMVLFFDEFTETSVAPEPVTGSATTSAQYRVATPAECSSMECIAHSISDGMAIALDTLPDGPASSLAFLLWTFSPETNLPKIIQLRALPGYVSGIPRTLSMYFESTRNGFFSPMIYTSQNGQVLHFRDKNGTLQSLDTLSGPGRVIAAHLVTLVHLAKNLPSIIESHEGRLLVIFYPKSIREYMESEGWPEHRMESVEYIVKKAMLQTLDAFEAKKHLGLITAFASIPLRTPESGHTASVTATPAVSQDAEALFSGRRRRSLQEVVPEDSKPADTVQRRTLRPATVLWLCVSLCVALIAALIPIWSLTSLNDPILATKLLTPAGH